MFSIVGSMLLFLLHLSRLSRIEDQIQGADGEREIVLGSIFLMSTRLRVEIRTKKMFIM